MESERQRDAPSERFLHALSGLRVVPPVRGLSFVDPELLPDSPARQGPGARDRAPARTLASACAHAGLDFAFVPSWEPWAVEATELLLEAGVAVAWVVPGILWPTLEDGGVLRAIRLAASAPRELSEPLDVAAAIALAGVEAGIRRGATCIVIADDMAGAAGPLLDPAFLAAEVFPRLARLTSVSRERGVPAVLHCDGDARRLMDAAREAGFVAVHGDAGGGTRWEAAVAASREAGLAVIGGIAAVALAVPETASAWAGRAFALAREGGVLVSDDGGVTLAGEAEALLAVLANDEDRVGNA